MMTLPWLINCGRVGPLGLVPGILTHELVEALGERRMDVACVQEVWWRGSGCRLFGAIGKKYKLFWMRTWEVSQRRMLADCYGLVLHATGPTHKLGGTLDAVISHSVTGCPSCVAVEDVGLSDHYLLRWEVSTTQAAVPTTSICCRPWLRLDIERLRSELLASRLC